MSKKKFTPPPDTTISITLPGSGGIVRKGTMVVTRGSMATLRQFEYSSIADIADAIAAATESIVRLEAAPPPNIQTTDKDVYRPDLEQRKAALIVGARVGTKDGKVGEIAEIKGDDYLVALDGDEGEPAPHKLEDLRLVPAAVHADSVGPDPLTVKGKLKDEDARPATDYSPTGEQPEQLAIF